MGQTLLATTPEALQEHQPWTCPHSNCVVVTDSRLDNRPELAKILACGGGSLDAVGDAELIHTAFQRWGSGCVERLLGDFAFAIWDPKRRRLFVARDPMGVRPLYFHFSPGQLLAFASQPEAMLTLPPIPRELNEARILDFLVEPLEGIDKTSTFFKSIERLPPAHWLQLKEGQIKTQRYWRPASAPLRQKPSSDGEWVEGLRERLELSVRRRCRSQGTVGSMLSGGLDSSSVVAIANRLQTQSGCAPLPTYSAISADPDCPETMAVRAMLAHQPLDAVLLDYSSIPELLDAIAQDWAHMGEPFDAHMTLVASQYKAASRQGVRIVMDGIDADGLLSEGDYMQQLLRRGRWRTLWNVAQGQSRFYKGEWSVLRHLRPVVGSALGVDRLRRMVRKWTGQNQRQLQAELAVALIQPDFAKRADLQSRLMRLSAQNRYQDFVGPDQSHYSYMESTFTTVGVERYGRVAAQMGLEPRHPFLDRELIEYCAWMPLDLRMRDGWPKWGLRAAMDSSLPSSVVWRKGKEHLGWRFDAAMFPRVATNIASPDLLDRACLAPYLRVTELQPWPRFPEPVHPEAPHWEANYNALALAVWLNSHKASGTLTSTPNCLNID
jgi:asparagine synthase (glutamine-hydrolysing)